MPWFRIHGKSYLLNEEDRRRHPHTSRSRWPLLNPRSGETGPSSVPTQEPAPTASAPPTHHIPFMLYSLILVRILTLLFSHKHKILYHIFLYVILWQVGLSVIHHRFGTQSGHLISRWRWTTMHRPSMHEAPTGSPVVALPIIAQFSVVSETRIRDH